MLLDLSFLPRCRPVDGWVRFHFVSLVLTLFLRIFARVAPLLHFSSGRHRQYHDCLTGHQSVVLVFSNTRHQIQSSKTPHFLRWQRLRGEQTWRRSVQQLTVLAASLPHVDVLAPCSPAARTGIMAANPLD